jgi:hypothetical protein
MSETTLGFDRSSSLLDVAGSKRCEQIPHKDHALTAPFREALLHEKAFALGECLSNLGAEALRGQRFWLTHELPIEPRDAHRPDLLMDGEL